MRSIVPIAAILAMSLAAMPVRAASPDEVPPDQQTIDSLAARASQAPAREQCFLYAELMHQMTELSLRQYAAGDVTKAAALLKEIQGVAHKIHLSLADNDKRLKNAEILLSRTAFRLTELLQSSDYQDRPLVQQTLADVSQAQNAALMQVFRK